MSSEESSDGVPRSADRVTLTAEVSVRRPSAHAFRVRVLDASPRGLKLEFVDRPKVGERVWVKFTGLESLEATVRWVEGRIGGVQFEHPIHPAVFQRLTS
jgi:hypothetical protein